MLRMNFTRLCSKKYEDEYENAFGDIVKHPMKLSGKNRQQDTKINLFLYSELLMFTAYKVYERPFTIDEMLVLFSGVHCNFIDIDIKKDRFIIQAHTFLASHEDEWNKRALLTHFYFIQKDHNTKIIQMFKADQDLLKNKEAKIYFNDSFSGFKDRLEKYNAVLTDPQYIGLIPMEGDNEEHILTEYLECRIKEKKSYDVYEKVKESLKSINNDFVNSMGKHYPDNYKLIGLKEVNKPLPHLLHIAGKTGDGKSVLFDIYIKKLVSQGLKILYVTDTHAPNSINTKLKLDDLGLDTTIIMGKERSKHINKFISTQEGKSIPELIMKYPDLFSNIDYTCYNIEYLECKSCKKKEQCGFYNMYKRLPKTQVVIITPFNLIDSIAAAKVDKYRRSMYEILSIWADVILFDEADKLQTIGDDRLISSTEVYSLDTIERSNKQHLEGFLKILYNAITRKNIVTDDYVRRFKTIVNNYDREIDLLHMLFLADEGSGLVRKEYGGKNFTIRQLIDDWSEEYISSIVADNGSKELDIAQYNNRFYALLTYRIDNIRSKYINYLLTIYEDSDIEIDSTFNEIFDRYRKEVSNLELSEEELNNLIDGNDIDTGKIKVNFKKKRKVGTAKRNEMLTFILLLSSIDNYLNRIYDLIKPVLDSLANDHNYISISTNAQNHLLAPKALIRDADGFRINIDKNGTKLIKNSYSGIGREILFENPRVVARIYNFQQPFTILTSATSAGTESSKYNLKYPVTHLLKREGSDYRKVNVKCHIFYKGDTPISVSGVEIDNQINALKNLTQEINKNLIAKRSKDIDTGILISTSSYANAKAIGEELIKVGHNAKILYHELMGDYDPNIHITKLDIEKRACEADIFIAVNIIIERGFNVVNDKGESYFRDIIIMNRALPSPNDILESTSYFHKELNKSSIGSSYREIKRNMYKLHKELRHFKGFRRAPQYIKDSIAGNTLVQLKQLSGRGQRGGTNVTVHIVDASFYPLTAEQSIKDDITKIIDDRNTSLFIAWQEMLNKGDELANHLYNDLKDGFNNYELILHR